MNFRGCVKDGFVLFVKLGAVHDVEHELAEYENEHFAPDDTDVTESDRPATRRGVWRVKMKSQVSLFPSVWAAVILTAVPMILFAVALPVILPLYGVWLAGRLAFMNDEELAEITGDSE